MTLDELKRTDTQAAARQARQALKQARKDLEALQGDLPRFEEVLDRAEANLRDATGDQLLEARSRRDAAGRMLDEHKAAITDQHAEVEGLQAEAAQRDRERELVETFARYEKGQNERQKAVDKAVRELRKHTGRIDALDNELAAAVSHVQKLADELSVQRPGLRVQRRVQGDAPTPLLEALDAALTAERAIRKNRRRIKRNKQEPAA